MKVADMHCDTIAEIWYSQKSDHPQNLKKNSLAIDIERLRKGDYLIQNFAMFVDTDRKQDPLESLMELIEVFYNQMEQNKDEIGVVRSFQDIEANRQAGKMSALLTMEEGATCRGNISILRNLYRLGVRMATITWNHENCLGFPNNSCAFPGAPNTINGLKQNGIDIVKEMERLGIIIDVSHLSDAGFYDVYNNTQAPFVASHSNARTLCGHCRNLTDDMILKIAERGGVIGINYCSEFLMTPDENGKSVSRVSDMARHARYLMNLGGIDCIGLGSDFDGIGGELEMKDCSMLPLLEQELRYQGFHESEIEKIFYQNVLRVYKEVLK